MERENSMKGSHKNIQEGMHGKPLKIEKNFPKLQQKSHAHLGWDMEQIKCEFLDDWPLKAEGAIWQLLEDNNSTGWVQRGN